MRDNSPAVEAIKAHGDILHIFVNQGGREVPVAQIEPQVIEGNVYLFTHHISSVVHQTEFILDLSGSQFPRDWKKRLYWIAGESIRSPLYPFAKNRFHELDRRKIKIE